MGLLLALTALPAAAASGGRVSLLVIDVDSYLAQSAVNGLNLPSNIEVRAFTLADLTENSEAAAFVAASPVLLVDIMDDNLSGYVIDHQLLPGRRVFALRESKDDQSLKALGFDFNPELAGYFYRLSRANIRNMLKRAVNLSLDPETAYGPVEPEPEQGLYHPRAPAVFASADDYLKWYEKRPGYDRGRPRLGLMFFSTSLTPGQVEALNRLIGLLEDGGFNVLPAFGQDRLLIDSYFLTPERKSRVEAVLSFSLKFYSAVNAGLRQSLADLDVPVFNAVNLYSSATRDWQASDQGLPPLDVIWTLATPEMSGAIEPTPIMGKVEERDPQSGGRVYRYELIEGLAGRLMPRIHNWIKLRRLANGEKKVAIFYYNNSQGKQNIGASYLNVFRSLEEIVDSMRKAGYRLEPDSALDEETIKGLVLRGGRNIGSWAPGELDALIASGQTVQLPVGQYKAWLAELPPNFRQKVLEQWGEPEQSDLMIKNGRIIIPMVRAGNVIMLPEPPRGVSDDPLKLYHDPVLYPHHQYIAAYLWIARVFRADAMVHLGTHATYEWLPGKQAGLSLSCPPEIMVTDIPNIYPYIVDDVGEGLQAKRRGRGLIIDHLIPPLAAAGAYHEYLELQDLCQKYEQAESFGAQTAGTYLEQIRRSATALGLDKDLELSAGLNGPGAVAALSQYLEYLEKGSTPYGLHSFGRSPSAEALAATAEAVLSRNRGVEKSDLAGRLAQSGPRETANFLRALEGRYVPPAEGHDPIRNPGSLPTGRNFYGLAPNRLPTRAAWDLGQKAADDLIGQYLEANGVYPDKVAVVLWAVESLRNEGLNESTILALIGVEPVWNPGGLVTGVRPVAGARLGRPRVDVAVNASGLYRDLFPDKIIFLDEAIRQAAVQDDIENFISRNDGRIKTALLKSGLGEEEAGRFSRARIFSEAPGAYGNRVEELASASGLWEDDSAIADVYRDHSGFAYGADFWGAPAKASLDENLRESKVAWHSVSSNLYGLMDNDDMFMYLGGLSSAIARLSGRAPRTLIADQRSPGRVTMEPLGKFIGQEMRSRYLNPKWIQGMKAENYAGAREMSNYVEYLWGWQVTTPEALDESYWEQTYEVYVEDKYGQGLKEFLNRHNPWAYQSLAARMLESTRKGYWEAGDEIVRNLAAEYALNVIARGLACCDHTCNNPQLNQMVLNIISLPGVMSPELAAEFKLAVEKAGQKSLEDMVADRLNLLKDLGRMKPAEAAPPGAEAAGAELESVRGLKMEKVENLAEKTSLSSSGVEWFASLFVVALVFLFFLGVKRRPKY
jgi:cobaltochelatase CobN